MEWFITYVLSTVCGVFIAGLLLYMAYRVGHSSGIDHGVRSEAREFYPHETSSVLTQASRACEAHDCAARDACCCYKNLGGVTD